MSEAVFRFWKHRRRPLGVATAGPYLMERE
jgi:hypothetical protein